MEPTANGFDHFLTHTITYGLAYVFLVAFCFAFVVIIFACAFATVQLIRKAPARVNLWIDNDIETKQAVSRSANKLTETLGPIGTLVHKTHQGVTHLAKAADAHVTRHPDQYDADVHAHVQNAKEALNGGPQ
jgi:hypothetical protein